MHSFVELERICLILGMACNFKCRYCIQKNLSHPRISKHPSQEVITFLSNQAKRRPRHAGQRAPLKIQFFGGEPLLYFETIKEVIHQVPESNIEWSVVTNASLLTDEIVQFFNEHKVRVNISWDGNQSESARTMNVLKDMVLLERIFRLNQFTIDAVLSAYCQDPYQLRAEVKQAFGQPVSTKFSFMEVDPSTPLELLNYDLPAWKLTCDRMAQAALKQFLRGNFTSEDWESALYRRYIFAYYDTLENKRKGRDHGFEGGRMNVDLDGRVWFCNHAVAQIGTIGDLCQDINRRAELHFDQLVAENNQHCVECAWYPFCNLCCPRQSQSIPAERQCQFLAVFFSSVADVMRQFEATKS
mgnify:FL=1